MISKIINHKFKLQKYNTSLISATQYFIIRNNRILFLILSRYHPTYRAVDVVGLGLSVGEEGRGGGSDGGGGEDGGGWRDSGVAARPGGLVHRPLQDDPLDFLYVKMKEGSVKNDLRI